MSERRDGFDTPGDPSPLDDGMPPDEGLTPEEKAAFAGLPRERPPSEVLRGRVVQELRGRGLLGEDRTWARPRTPVRESSLRLPPWAAAAAAIALVVGGAAFGHRMGARAATDALLAAREQDVALRVQEVGSAYVRSLLALEQHLTDGADTDEGHGREVAAWTLYAAASVLARLEPADPALPGLVELLEERLAAPPGAGAAVRTFSF